MSSVRWTPVRISTVITLPVVLASHVIVMAGVDAASSQADVPEELVALCNSRDIPNLEIRWVHDAPRSWFDKDRSGRFKIWQVNKYYRDASCDVRSWHNLGDDDGLVLVGQRGAPYSYDPKRMFIDNRSDTAVDTRDTDITCQRRYGVYSALPPVPDPRAIGLLPWYRNNLTPREALTKIRDSFDRFEVERGPMGTVITGWNATLPNGVRWTIDSTGELVYSCASISPDGVPIEECVCDYSEGTIPRRAQFSHAGGVAEHTIEMLYVEEGHLSQLTMGEELRMFPGRKFYSDREVSYWDGQQEMPGDFGDAVDKLDLRRYKNLLETHGVVLGRSPRSPFPEIFGDLLLEAGAASADQVRLWEPYVRAFLAYYECTTEQRRHAEELLERAQSRAYGFIDDHKHDERRFDEAISELLKSDARNRDARLKRLNDDRARVYEPIHLIFQRDLRSPLYSMLTTEQEKKAKFDSD